MVVTSLCLFIPATLLLQLLYHGFAGLHGRRLGQSLGPHQLLAPLCLPSLDGGQPATPAAGRCVVFSIKHAVARPRRVSTNMEMWGNYILRNMYTYLPTFLLVLKEEEEEEDVEEVKLYDFDWTVPPETIKTQTFILVTQL